MESLNKSLIIFIDCETTSVSAEVSQVLTLSYRAVDDGGVLIEKDTLNVSFRRDHFPDPKAILVNKINPFKYQGLTEAVAAERFSGMISDMTQRYHGHVYLCAHNINFDRKFIRSLYHRGGRGSDRLPPLIDTMDLAAKAYSRGLLDLELLIMKEGKNVSRPSLNMESVSRAIGEVPQKERLHTSDYDTELNEKIFFHLKKKLNLTLQEVIRPRSEDFEKNYGNQAVLVKFYDNISGEVKEKALFFTGTGVGKFSSAYGYHSFYNTVAVDLNKLKGEDGEYPNLSLENMDNAVSEVDLRYHPSIISIDKIETPADLANQLDALRANASFIISERRLAKIEKEAKEKARSLGFDADATPAADYLGLFPEVKLEPAMDLAAKKVVAGAPSKEAAVTELRGLTPGYGRLFAETLYVRYAQELYLAGDDKFKSAGEARLTALLPNEATPTRKRVKVDLLDSKASKKQFEKNKIIEVELLCNGQDITVSALHLDGTISEMDSIPVMTASPGQARVTYPQANDINDRLMAVFGVNKSGANELRSGFKTFADTDSFIFYKKMLSYYYDQACQSRDVAGKNALGGAIDFMNKPYREVISGLRLAPVDQAAGALESSQVDPGSQLKLTATDLSECYGALVRELEYNEQDVTILGRASYIINEIRKTQTDPRSALDSSVEEMDQRRYLRLCEGDLELASSDVDNLDKNSPDGGPEHLGTPIRCKVCSRMVTSSNAVGGMGPTCAKKLSEWLESPQFIDSAVFDRQKKHISEYMDGDTFPIMIVKDKKTGSIFASDVIKKLPDGRLMAIDLSSVSHTDSSSKQLNGESRGGHIKDIMHVFLNDENFEVKSVFGDRKKV